MTPPTPLPLFSYCLFAAEVANPGPQPTWTDKEVMTAMGGAFVSLLGVVAGVVPLLVRWRCGHLISHNSQLVKQNAALKKEADEARSLAQTSQDDVTPLRMQAEQPRVRLDEAVKRADESRAAGEAEAAEAADLRSERDSLKAAVANLSAKCEEFAESARRARRQEEVLTAQLVNSAGELKTAKQQVSRTAYRVKRALSIQGQLWTDTVHANAPPHRPLTERRVPILSMLNLKGGVGKTTVVANLGSALSSLGYRVLLVDLDLQGSLTELFLNGTQVRDIGEARRLVSDFFDRGNEKSFPKLADYRQPVFDGRSGLVATADYLAYSEANMALRWTLRTGRRDPRFLLRRALHAKSLTSRYDIVLLDCPPLINMSCVNALAASDYLIIPVLPSAQTMDRVPPLLRRVRQIKENINSELKVMGILANRTHQESGLTDGEKNRFSALRVKAKDEWGEEVTVFDTVIRSSAKDRDCEDESRCLRPGDDMFDVFLRLTRELERRLPNVCLPKSRVATIPGGVQ